MLSRLAAPLRTLEPIEGSFSKKHDSRHHSSGDHSSGDHSSGDHSGHEGGAFAEGLCVVGGCCCGGEFGEEGRAEAAGAAPADDATVSAPSIRRTSDVRAPPPPPPTLTPLTPSPLTQSRAPRLTHSHTYAH